MAKITVYSDDSTGHPALDVSTPGYLVIYLGPNGDVKTHGEGLAKVGGAVAAPFIEKVDIRSLIGSLFSKSGGSK